MTRRHPPSGSGNGRESVSLRAMTLDDYHAVRRLWEAADGVGLDASDERPAIAAYLERNPGLSVVGEAGGEVIAAVLCGHDGRRGCLSHLVVAEAAWGSAGGSSIAACSAWRGSAC